MAQILAGGSEPNAGGNTEVITQVQTATWTQLQGKPYIEVSSKGIVNGLSNIPNDGADFGPDTTKGATAPGQYGSPYTETTGIYEVLNYSISSGLIVANKIHTTPIKLHGSNFIISTSNTITASLPVNNLEIYAEGDVMGNISCQNNSGYALNFGSEFSTTTFILHSVGAVPGDGYTPEGFINISNSSNSVSWISYYFQVFSGFTTTGLNIDGFYSAYFYENQLAPGTTTITLNNGYDVGFFGGSNYEVDVSNVNNLTSISSTFIGNITSVAFTLTFIGGSVNIPGFGGTFGQIVIAGVKTAGAAPLMTLNGTTTIKSMVVNGLYENNGSTSINFSMIDNSNSDSLTIDNIQVHGVVTDSGVLPVGYYLTPTISANPPVSGTAYQNTNPYDIRLKIPVTYSPTSSAAATLATGTSSSSTVTTSTKVSYPAGITTGIINTYEMVVPAGHYFELVVTNATIGTVEVQVA